MSCLSAKESFSLLDMESLFWINLMKA